MNMRRKIEKFRDENPDLAPLPQMALDEGEDSPVWDRVVKLIEMYERPEMTEREWMRRSERWMNDNFLDDVEKHGDLYRMLMRERLKGQLQAYEMSLYRFSQFEHHRAIELTRNTLGSLEALIER